MDRLDIHRLRVASERPLSAGRIRLLRLPAATVQPQSPPEGHPGGEKLEPLRDTAAALPDGAVPEEVSDLRFATEPQPREYHFEELAGPARALEVLGERVHLPLEPRPYQGAGFDVAGSADDRRGHEGQEEFLLVGHSQDPFHPRRIGRGGERSQQPELLPLGRRGTESAEEGLERGRSPGSNVRGRDGLPELRRYAVVLVVLRCELPGEVRIYPDALGEEALAKHAVGRGFPGEGFETESLGLRP